MLVDTSKDTPHTAGVVQETPPPIRYGELVERLPDGPIDLTSLIEGEGALELDIGFGRGRSLLERARGRRDVRVLGVEIKTKWAFKVAARLRREQLTNARAICADIRTLLERAEPEGCLSRAFVHFPDPWWKKRHDKRRVVSVPVLDRLARLIEPSGELFIQTDVEERADLYEALLLEHSSFGSVAGGSLRVAENPFGARSNREVRADEDGLPVYRLLARRLG